MTNPDFLRGPWMAVLADSDGFVFESIDQAREDTEDPNETLTVSVVRGSAAPTDHRMPGSWRSGDLVFELDDLYLGDEEDISTSAEARYAQAQAMAAGLNAAAEVSA